MGPQRPASPHFLWQQFHAPPPPPPLDDDEDINGGASSRGGRDTAVRAVPPPRRSDPGKPPAPTTFPAVRFVVVHPLRRRRRTHSHSDDSTFSHQFTHGMHKPAPTTTVIAAGHTNVTLIHTCNMQNTAGVAAAARRRLTGSPTRSPLTPHTNPHDQNMQNTGGVAASARHRLIGSPTRPCGRTGGLTPAVPGRLPAGEEQQSGKVRLYVCVD